MNDIQKEIDQIRQTLRNKYIKRKVFTNKELDDIADFLAKASEKGPVSSIEGLPCGQAHTIELFLRGGKIESGTAIGPHGRAGHVWVNRDGIIVDLFGWKEHKKQTDYPFEYSALLNDRYGDIKETLEYLRKCKLKK